MFTIDPKRTLTNEIGDLPSPSNVSSLIEVSPSAFNETVEE